MKYLKIDPKDNVAVCLTAMSKGETVELDGRSIVLAEDIPQGHKVLTEDVDEGTNIIKYGFPIGRATTALRAGAWVNEHNLKTNLAGTLSYEYRPDIQPLDIKKEQRYFMGFERQNGDVGIRNEVWIVPTVGCVNGIAEQIARRMAQETQLPVVAWHHNYGCSQLSDDHENTRRVLRDLVLHPNAGAVLVVGLGCENNQPEAFMHTLGNYDKSRIGMMISREAEGDETEWALNLLRPLVRRAEQDARTQTPISKLRVGLKCGGSDGLSGITANPLVGRFSDWLVAQGGTTVLTEVPEMFGAETILMNRCKSEEIFQQTVELINGFKEYFLSHGEPVGENPSPGNKAGGISTLEEKALGCTQKGGRAIVEGVLGYGERLQHNGLNLLSAPGNDLVATTALGAAGCHLALFTTGRGTPFGSFVPTMKISTNSQLFRQKPHWIDFNAGELAESTTFDELLPRFIDQVISVADGEPTCNEKNGYREIAIFKTGVTL